RRGQPARAHRADPGRRRVRPLPGPHLHHPRGHQGPGRTGVRAPRPARPGRGHARRHRRRGRSRRVRVRPRPAARVGGMRRPESPGAFTAKLANGGLAVPVTGRGVGLGLAAVTLLFTGWRWGYPELVAIGAAAGLACVAAISVIAVKPSLEVERSIAPDRVSVGESATVTLEVRNTGRFRAVNARAVDTYGGPTHATRRVAVPLARLRPGKAANATYEVTAERRGVVD